MTRTGLFFTFVACCVAGSVTGQETTGGNRDARGSGDTALRNMLVINEDNSHFFGLASPRT